MNPNTAVVPILKVSDGDRVTALLGTGFFVGNGSLVTAKHVLADAAVGPGENLGFAHQMPDGVTAFYGFSDFLYAERFDIACVPDTRTPGARSLPICLSEASMSSDVLAYEFSSTVIRQNADGTPRVELIPYSHKGNVMRHYISDFPEAHPTPCFDTSFPALQGASGAPVVLASELVVVGMLVGNLERHLIPAQVTRIEADPGVTEEIRYFLPLGRGLEGKLIAAFLADKGIEFDAVEISAPAG